MDKIPVSITSLMTVLSGDNLLVPLQPVKFLQYKHSGKMMKRIQYTALHTNPTAIHKPVQC